MRTLKVATYTLTPITTRLGANVSYRTRWHRVVQTLTRLSEQQITLYPHRDTNNDWRIVNTTNEDEPAFDWENNPVQYIYSGMKIKLEHITTYKHLHSHDVRPPISEQDFMDEVSGYGFEGFAGDANDYWILEIYDGDKRDKESYTRLRTLKTKFRLQHHLRGCYLYSHKVKLPDWGWEQQEVTCNKNAPKANSLWYVETNIHPQCELLLVDYPGIRNAH
jgi:dolichyl-phosphate-mannose-protein mannosyltransferase